MTALKSISAGPLPCFVECSAPLNAETAAEIVHASCKVMGVPVAYLYSNSRQFNTALARHIAMHLMRRSSDWSLTQIGTFLKRDHGTVMHAIERIKRERDFDKSLHLAVSRLEAQFPERKVKIRFSGRPSTKELDYQI